MVPRVSDPIDTLEREERVSTYLAEEREAAHLDLRFVMGSIEGRRFIDMLRRDTGVRALSFGPDDRATSFNEGRRSVGIDLEARLEHPDLIDLVDRMEKERRDRIRNRAHFIASGE